jgi:hypothetical protein
MGEEPVAHVEYVTGRIHSQCAHYDSPPLLPDGRRTTVVLAAVLFL